MIIRTVYKCDYCGQEYLTPDECKNCENQHVKPVEIIQQNNRFHYHSPFDSDMWKYPVRIRIKMDNGDIVSYYYERDAMHDKNV